MTSGQKLKTFTNDDYLVSNSQYIVKDESWMVIPLMNVLLWRKVDLLVLDVELGQAKFLAALEKPLFSAPKLTVR
jgi:hypothetical protein